MRAILSLACIGIIAIICGCVGTKDPGAKTRAGTSGTPDHVIYLRHPNHPKSNPKGFQWYLDAWTYHMGDKNPFRLKINTNRIVEWRMEDDKPDFAIIVLDTNHWAAPTDGWKTDIFPPFNCRTCGGVISTDGSVSLTFKGTTNTHYEIVVPGSVLRTKDTANTQTNDMVDATIVYDPTDSLKNPK